MGKRAPTGVKSTENGVNHAWVHSYPILSLHILEMDMHSINLIYESGGSSAVDSEFQTNTRQ